MPISTEQTTDQDSLLVPGKVVRLRERLWRVDYRDVRFWRDSPGRARYSRVAISPGAGNGGAWDSLPDTRALGDDRQQQLLLDAYKFSLLHGTAPILGLQRSRAIPTDFQLVPLLMALNTERVRLLIADDVGTGKTVEAGLILAELLARGRARRILIVVPANLRDQWRDTLETMFHIAGTVVAGHLLPALERRLLPGQSVWAAQDVVIASIDYLRRARRRSCHTGGIWCWSMRLTWPRSPTAGRDARRLTWKGSCLSARLPHDVHICCC